MGQDHQPVQWLLQILVTTITSPKIGILLVLIHVDAASGRNPAPPMFETL